jgi:hypothetical protein
VARHALNCGVVYTCALTFGGNVTGLVSRTVTKEGKERSLGDMARIGWF